MIKCISMAIYYHIYNRSSEIAIDIFDENLCPLEVLLLLLKLNLFQQKYSIFKAE